MKAKRLVYLVSISGSLALCTLPLAHAQQTTPGVLGNPQTQAMRGQLNESDYRFLEKAARGGLEEVELGQLAQQKASNQAVRTFGQRMVTDHNKLNNELKQLAAQKGATVPTSMTHHENSTLQHLQGEVGADFDKDYAKDMVKDHRKDLKEFQDAARKVQDPDLRAFAQKAVPILQEHLGMAENMETSVKNEK